MPRGSFLIEDILNKSDNSSSTDQTMTSTHNNNNNHHHHPFKKRAFSQIDTDQNDDSATNNRFLKCFKRDTLITHSLPHHQDIQSNFVNNNNDLFLNTILQNIQHSQCDQQQQQQLLNNYYSLLIQQQQQQQDYQFQNAFLMSKLFMPNLTNKSQQQQPVNKNSFQINEQKQFQTSSNKIKPNSSISSSPASSSSTELYNISSTNLSPQSNNDDCSSSMSCIENVSPLDALLQLANSTFIHKTSNHDNNNNNNNNSSCLMDQQQQKLMANASIADDTVLLNNDILLVQQQQQSLQLEKQAKTSLNSSFESNSAILLNTHTTTNNHSNSKRKRKNRTAFTANQIFELEKRFSNQRYLSPHDRDRIAYELSLSTAQVITWFQNRRAKQKRDIEEMKNDVTAAKNCKVLDPDLDVDKVLHMDRFSKYDQMSKNGSDRNSINQEDYENNNNNNATMDEYDEIDEVDNNQEDEDEVEEDNNHQNSINNFDSNSNITDKSINS